MALRCEVRGSPDVKIREKKKKKILFFYFFLILHAAMMQDTNVLKKSFFNLVFQAVWIRVWL